MMVRETPIVANGNINQYIVPKDLKEKLSENWIRKQQKLKNEHFN